MGEPWVPSKITTDFAFSTFHATKHYPYRALNNIPFAELPTYSRILQYKFLYTAYGLSKPLLFPDYVPRVASQDYSYVRYNENYQIYS